MRSSGTPRDSPPGWQEFATATPPRAGEAGQRPRVRPLRAAPAGVAQHPSHPAARGRSSAPAGARDPWARMRSRPCVLRCALEGTQSPAQWRAGGGCSLHAPRGRRDGRQSCATRAGGERAGGEWRPRPRTSTCRVNPRGPQRERAARRRADAAPRLWCVSKPWVCSPPGSLTHPASHRPLVDSGSLPLWGLQPRPHGPPPQTAGPSPRAVWGAKGSCVLDKGCAECPLRAGGATRLPRRGQRARHTAALTADPAGWQMPLHPTAPAGGGSRPWQ